VVNVVAARAICNYKVHAAASFELALYGEIP